MSEQLDSSSQIAERFRRSVVGVGGAGSTYFFLLLIAASLLFFTMLDLFWVGFLGSDDAAYWAGSTGWLQHFPYLGRDHWTLRHTLVIPMALARLVFGDGATSLFLPTLLYAEGLILIIGIWAWRSVGPRAVIAVLPLIVTFPQLVIYSSTADIDVVEIFFVFGAFFFLSGAMAKVDHFSFAGSSGDASYCCKPLLAGVFLGFALLSRETAVFAVVAVALLCVVQYRLKRKYYLFILLGLFAVTGLELLYLWSQSGHPFYRYSLDVHHDSNVNRWADQGAAIPFVHPALDPFTMLLLNHNFGLTAWIALPLSIWLVRRRDMEGPERTLTVLLGALALVWSTLSAGLWKSLVLIPRYYLVPSICLLVLAGLALSRLWHDGRRWLAATLGALLVMSNVAALSLDNRNFMLGEYKLVELAKRQAGIIHSDPETVRRAGLLLDWAGVRERVTATPIHSGDLVFVNPLRPYHGALSANGWNLLYESVIPLSGGHFLACSMPERIVPKAMIGNFGCRAESLRLYQVGTIR